MVGIDEGDGRLFDGHAVARDVEGVGADVFGGELLERVVLDDERAPLLDVLHELRVKILELGSRVERADAEDDCLVFAERLLGEVGVGERSDFAAQTSKRLERLVTGSRKVSNMLESHLRLIPRRSIFAGVKSV